MKIRNLDLTRNPINVEHEQLGLPPVEEPVSHPGTHPLLRAAMWFIVLVLIVLILFLTGRFFLSNNWVGGWQIIGDTISSRVFWSAVVVGFFAQVVDGALGMAYGVTATTFLLATGASPGAASASVHIAEIFTTGVSGISHAKFGNVNKQLFVRLLVPGILGGSIGRNTGDADRWCYFQAVYIHLFAAAGNLYPQQSVSPTSPAHAGPKACGKTRPVWRFRRRGGRGGLGTGGNVNVGQFG